MVFYLYYQWFKKYRRDEWLALRSKCIQRGQDYSRVVRDYILREVMLIDIPVVLIGGTLVYEHLGLGA